MVRYAKTCGCFALRYGVILIAAIDIILGVYVITTTAIDMVKEHDKFQHHANKTDLHDNKKAEESHSKHESFQASSIVNIVLQVLNIAMAISLIAVASINKEKYRKILFIWIGWNLGSAIMLVITTIVRSVTAYISWIEICILLLIAWYLVFCIWLVMSYYKLLAFNTNEAPAGYGEFANEKDDEMFGV